MTSATVDDYRARFSRVLAFIDQHLEEGDLTVDRLSAVAAFSKFHFHRQFSQFFRLGVFRYVQSMRLRRASYQLAFRADRRILDIALASGYESHEAFARAFKKLVGQTPSEFRDRPQWEPWHATYQRLRELRSEHMTTRPSTADVKLIDFPATRVGLLEHRGAPDGIGDTIRRFIAWRRQNHLHPTASATYNLLYGDPDDTPPDQFRLDLCAAIGPSFAVTPNDCGVVESVIPAGRCAVLRHVGTDDTLGQSLGFLYGSWLPGSGQEPRDFPLFLQRVTMFPDVAEHEAVVDIFLPLR